MEQAKDIIYEQPLNELLRAALRLEHLFTHIDRLFASNDMDDHILSMMRLMIDALNLLDRPDLKTKLGKAFHHYILSFSRLIDSPDIEEKTLQETLRKLKALQEYFFNTPGKIAQSLRDNEFLTGIRQSLLTAGGDSSMDAPAYYYWLQQPEKVHIKQIQSWLSTFSKIREAIDLLLSIVRQSAQPRKLQAENGFYHEVLDTQMPCQLIRVGLSEHAKVFPVISAGKHRLSIRFLVPSMIDRPVQTDKNLKFKLTTCMI